ncbi:hypothetical protein [Shewanella gelidii]|uniref:Chitin-binding type-3 domain-containing protein n=1 Tax=Shewanella gelidii TaxID=1642821 RepID=A0A917JKS3_9GAMM|nr:hypothetical protein [Shewanella gelidii]MCL1097284.1 hypothetical protein [Shewanella gelidii]GGI73900.1 hypothetical protein GCM10009332_09270 [Shewanella gelidii]
MKHFKSFKYGVLMLALAGSSITSFAASKSQGQNNGKPFQELQSLIDSNLALIQANQGDISNLQSISTFLLSSLNDVDSQLANLDSRVTGNEAELASVNGELDAIDGSLIDLYANISQLADRHSSDMANIQNQIDSLSNAVSGNSIAINELSIQLAAKAQELSQAIADNALAVDGLTTDLSLLNAQLNLLSLELTSAVQQLAALELRAANHEAEIVALMLRISTVEDIVENHSHDVDLTGVELSYESEGRDVHIFKTERAAVLADNIEFCESRGLAWWSPKSSVDAQLLLDNARAIDNYHTWVQVYGLITTTGNPATMNGFPFYPDSPSCVAGSSSGWAGVRDWGCSLCDPDSSSYGGNGLSYCWDTSHQYDWFACEAD